MEQNEMLEKAFTFFEGACKKYRDGKVDEALSDIKWGNDTLDEFEADDLDTMSEEEVFGESRTFGRAYKIFESISESLYKSKDGQKVLGNIVKLIKENKVLKSEFDVYNTLLNVKNNVDVDRYISEAVTLIPNFTPSELKSNNQLFVNALIESKMNLDVEINEKENALFESIHYILSHNKSLSNLDKYQLSENVIKEHISKNILDEQTEKNVDLDKVLEENLSSMGYKHANALNDSEIKFLRKVLAENADVEGMFKKYKSDLIGRITEKINECKNVSDKDAWNSTMEIVENMSVSDDKTLMIEGIAKMMELKDSIENI